MKDAVEIRNFWQSAKRDPLVLCTLVKKTGSSYRNIGAKKLISLTTGETAGLLSGGCLESDIEKSARENADRLPFLKTFSTLSEEDRLMGYQTGCSGQIEILFEKIPAEIDSFDLYLPFGTHRKAEGVLVNLVTADRKFSDRFEQTNDGTFFESWIEPIELTIVGCGADADPYLDFAASLGWSLRFLDYRSDLTRPERFDGRVIPELHSLETLAEHIPTGPRSALVLMTHNFESDLKILSQLNRKEIAYVGCLGPRRRFDLLKQDLKKFYDQEIDAKWEKDRIKAPPGITSRNSSPSEIAFSIVADIQMSLNSGPSHG